LIDDNKENLPAQEQVFLLNQNKRKSISDKGNIKDFTIH